MRHRGEPLKALQHVVDMAFGRSFTDEQRIFVDALAYRKGKDIELRRDGEVPRREGARDRARSATRSAESVRAPDRPSGGGGSSRRHHRKRRRRVLEDRPHFVRK